MYPLSRVPFERGLEGINFIKNYAYFIINAPIDICSINWCHKSQVLPVFTLQIFIVYISWSAVSAEKELGKGSSLSFNNCLYNGLRFYAMDKRLCYEPSRWSHFISNSLKRKNYQLSWILSFMVNHIMETSYLLATVTKLIHQTTQYLLQSPAANQPIYQPSLAWAPPFYFSPLKKDIYGKHN